MYWDKAAMKWRAQCKGTYLGLHTTEEAAARAYNVAAERLEHPVIDVPPAGVGTAGAGASAGASGRATPKRAAPTTLATPATSKKMKL